MAVHLIEHPNLRGRYVDCPCDICRYGRTLAVS
jgi:hypothetical protein